MGKISKGILALIVFLIVLTFPFIYNIAMPGSNKAQAPKLEAAVSTEKKCIIGDHIFENMSDRKKNPEAFEHIIANHGNTLSHAGIIPGMEKSVRDQVVRQGNRKLGGLNGCIKCHQNRTKFCDRCHSYVGVQTVSDRTGCFACHNYPKNKKEFKVWNDAMTKEMEKINQLKSIK